MTDQRLEKILKPAGDGGAWTGIFLTPRESAGLGRRGRVPVLMTLNGHEFKAFAAPMGDGTHGIVVAKEMQKAAGVGQHDDIDVTLRVDATPRTVDVPTELATRLKASKAASHFFEELSFTHKKDFVTWINGAKRAETRGRRLGETIRLLEAGTKWKDK